MTPALRYLLTRSLANSLFTRLKRLKQPKYILGALVGGAYFYFYIYQYLVVRGPVRGWTLPGNLQVEIGALILLVATLLLSWILPASRAAIQFTEAEIAFLFPAPLTRRTLIVHKLIKSQLALLLLSVFMTVLTGRIRLGAVAWFAMMGWWVILNTLNMHRIAASFALQRLRERGLGDWKRRCAMLLAIGALAAGIEYTRRNFVMPPPGPNGVPDFAALFQHLVHQGPLVYVLAPFKLVVAPYFTTTLPTFLVALLPAFGIMVAHFLWVIAADTAFEETAIAASQRRAAFLAAYRQGDARFGLKSGKAKTPVWRLRPIGFAPLAFLWKSLLKFGGRRALLLWALLLGGLTVLVAFLQPHVGPKMPANLIVLVSIIGFACYGTLLFSLILVGQQASAQLRQGMNSMDLLKTYPLPGWQLALGELLGGVTLGTLLQWAAIGIGAFLISGFVARSGGDIPTLIAVAGALALLLPAFNIAMSILPAATALLFPAWFKPQDATSQGLENSGIRIMAGLMQLLAVAAALLPVAFFGACAWLVAQKFSYEPVWQITFAVGIGGTVLALESALGVAWLGNLYDRYDGSRD